MKHKCECGSRIFFERPVSVLNAFGGMIGLRNIKFFNCVRCDRSYTCSTEVGRKTLVAAHTGAALERQLMQLAVDGGYFETRDGKVSNVILTDDHDQLDVKRLDLEVKEEMPT